MSSKYTAPLIRQTWENFGIPVEGGRPRGFIMKPIQERPGEAGAMRAQAQIELAWCRSNGIARPTTRFLAYRICGSLGLSHEKVDSAEDQITLCRRMDDLVDADGNPCGIPIDAVRDPRSTHEEPWCADPDNAAKVLFDQLDELRSLRQEGQRLRVVFVTEADGTVPFMTDICDEFGVPVYSGSGSLPVSLTHKLARDAVVVQQKTGIATVVLMLTDLDLMGLRNIFVPAARDIAQFAAGYGHPDAAVAFRIGVTPDQVLHLPPHLRISGAPLLSQGRGKPKIEAPWWPRDHNGDQWILPTSEALLDILPGILRQHLEFILNDPAQRQAMIDTEVQLRTDAAAALAALL